jgi:hypothetical protein
MCSQREVVLKNTIEQHETEGRAEKEVKIVGRQAGRLEG